MRQLADVRRRLGTAEEGLAEARAERKRAEATFDAAGDRDRARLYDFRRSWLTVAPPMRKRAPW